MRGVRRDLFEPLAGASAFLGDGLDAGGPHECCRCSIPSGEELGATHGLLAEFGEPTFNQVEPTRIDGNEVKHKPGMPGEPALDACVAVGAIVIEDQMQRLLAGKLGLKPLEKLQELLMPVPGITLAGHPTFDDLQGGKQPHGAVTVAVVRATAAGLSGRPGCVRSKRLDLTLLIDAQHERVLRRCQVDTNHVGELLQELGITRPLPK